MNFLDLDFSTLQDIPPLQRYYETPRVSVTQKGLFSMNGAFQREAGTQRRFRTKISQDGRYLVLYPTEPANVCFSEKSGYVTHLALARDLAARGLQLPVVYTVAWCQEQEAWVGCCQELPQPPRVSTLTKSKGTGKGTAARSDP